MTRGKIRFLIILVSLCFRFPASRGPGVSVSGLCYVFCGEKFLI